MFHVLIAGQCSSPDPPGGVPANDRGAAASVPHRRHVEERRASVDGEIETGTDGAEERQDGSGGAGGRPAE